jgi:hypothetical protein
MKPRLIVLASLLAIVTLAGVSPVEAVLTPTSLSYSTGSLYVPPPAAVIFERSYFQAPDWYFQAPDYSADARTPACRIERKRVLDVWSNFQICD